ncbi:MAG: molecular chaperone [Sphingomonas sp.]|nr:molecular chaperone [Sphingomonas sp.]
MNLSIKAMVAAALLAAPILVPAQQARAGVGDLLVAPTRLVLNGGRGAELILNNIGDEPATYRISVEFRRMKPDGTLEEVLDPSDPEKAARDMIVYAPRRVTLAPREPQSIRISARPAKGLPDGEYRIHMLFRAIPPATPVTKASSAPANGLSFKLTPIYGVTIPVIVRLGNLEATAGISNVRLQSRDGKPAIALDLTRSGRRSTFGEVRILKPGLKDPIGVQRAVAVYTDVGQRQVVVPVDEKFVAHAVGQVTVQYVETYDDGSKTIAETQAVLR